MPTSLPTKHPRVSAWLCRIYLQLCIGPIRCPLSRMAAIRSRRTSTRAISKSG